MSGMPMSDSLAYAMKRGHGTTRLDASPYVSEGYDWEYHSRTGADFRETVVAWQDNDWMLKANCLDVDPEAYFPKAGPTTKKAKAAAGRCASCPVRDECYAYAKATDSVGIWGGVLLTKEGKEVVIGV